MTPKEQFLETPHAEEFKKIVAHSSFREALNYAMLVTLQEVTHIEQMNGAKAFQLALIGLVDKDEISPPTQPPTLHHDAYDPRKRNG